jgi:hypothetical protein
VGQRRLAKGQLAEQQAILSTTEGFLVVIDLGGPDFLAGLGVERDQHTIGGRKVDLVAIERDAAVGRMQISTSPSLGRSSAGSAKTGPPTARSRPRTDVIVRKSRRVEPSTSRQSHRRPPAFLDLAHHSSLTGASNGLHSSCLQ